MPMTASTLEILESCISLYPSKKSICSNFDESFHHLPNEKRGNHYAYSTVQWIFRGIAFLLGGGLILLYIHTVILLIMSRNSCREGVDRLTGGFALPREKNSASGIDLNDLLTVHPNSTFQFRMGTDAMKDAGILKGDTLLVDRSLDARHGRIILAVVDNEYIVRKYDESGRNPKLMPENGRYPPVELSDDGQEVSIWGVVVSSFRKYI